MTAFKKNMIILSLIAMWPMGLSACSAKCSLKNVFIETPLSDNAFFDMVDMKRTAYYFYQSIIKKFKALNKPVKWLTGEIKNSTDEHINTRIILERIRTQLITKNRVPFISTNGLEPSLAKKFAANASLILRGRISGMRKQDKNVRTVFYMTYLEIVQIKTGKILWADTFTIGKKIIKKRFR